MNGGIDRSGDTVSGRVGDDVVVFFEVALWRGDDVRSHRWFFVMFARILRHCPDIWKHAMFSIRAMISVRATMLRFDGGALVSSLGLESVDFFHYHLHIEFWLIGTRCSLVILCRFVFSRREWWTPDIFFTVGTWG